MVEKSPGPKIQGPNSPPTAPHGPRKPEETREASLEVDGSDRLRILAQVPSGRQIDPAISIFGWQID